MNKGEFNLLYEPWIRIARIDGKTELLSLGQTVEQAHQIKELAGDLPTQDFALLRLLLALLYAAFGKQADGSYLPLSPSDPPVRYAEDLLDRWATLWQMGAFPMPIVDAYLLRYEEQFYLFHPTHPFFQVPKPGRATVYTAAKLNGSLSESSNKARLFPDRTGPAKASLDFPEAARWLIHVNGYDDTSAKPSVPKSGLPSVGAGWLGKLGAVYAVGNNLFETLMLNMVLLPDGEDKTWGIEKPVWSLPEPKIAERTPIALPDNQAELLTLQSRRLSLHREQDKVVGFSLLGGDFFEESDEVFEEQYTLWSRRARPQSGQREFYPRRHDPARQLWRDLTALLADSDGSGLRSPGVVSWLARLRNEGLLPQNRVVFRTAGINYGDKDFFPADVLADSLTFSADILAQSGRQAAQSTLRQLAHAEKLVAELGNLARSLAQAAGDRDGKGARERAMEQGYHALDLPFRRWLEELVPLDGEAVDQAERAWREEAKQIIRAMGRQLVEEAGPAAFVGRMVKHQNKERLVSAPSAYNWFQIKTK